MDWSWLNGANLKASAQTMWDILSDSVKDTFGLGDGSSFGGKSLGDYVNQNSPLEIERRKKIVAALTLDPDPRIAAIQKKAQDEFVKTGKWNPKYTEEADKYRSILGVKLPSGLSPLIVIGGVALLALILRR